MNIKMRKKERGFLILYDMIGREIFSMAFRLVLSPCLVMHGLVGGFSCVHCYVTDRCDETDGRFFVGCERAEGQKGG